jgi:hypothetical protein
VDAAQSMGPGQRIGYGRHHAPATRVASACAAEASMNLSPSQNSE